ncbi:transmembrane protein 252 [Electrophorus electricus]|nr:transmembrane protein 252 [Electrophorus electricus]
MRLTVQLELVQLNSALQTDRESTWVLICANTMNKRKHLLAAGRLVVPTAGLSLICGGVLINSISSDQRQTLRDVFTYLVLMLGFILLATGMLWAVSHGMKKVLFKQSRRSLQGTEIHVFTVDRPNFYPPSYEESQVGTNVVGDIAAIPTGTRILDLAPPVYTESCSETFNETFSLEQPPGYQQAVLQCWSEPQASGRSAPSEFRSFQVV